MAHEIMFTLPNQPLGKVDAQFTVKKDGQILGTLKVQKGRLTGRLWITHMITRLV